MDLVEAGHTGKGDFSGAKGVATTASFSCGLVTERVPLTSLTEASVPTQTGRVGEGPFSHTTGAMVVMGAVDEGGTGTYVEVKPLIGEFLLFDSTVFYES